MALDGIGYDEDRINYIVHIKLLSVLLVLIRQFVALLPPPSFRVRD